MEGLKGNPGGDAEGAGAAPAQRSTTRGPREAEGRDKRGGEAGGREPTPLRDEPTRVPREAEGRTKGGGVAEVALALPNLSSTRGRFSSPRPEFHPEFIN